jgi:hypothetical protein
LISFFTDILFILLYRESKSARYCHVLVFSDSGLSGNVSSLCLLFLLHLSSQAILRSSICCLGEFEKVLSGPEESKVKTDFVNPVSSTILSRLNRFFMRHFHILAVF